FATYGYQIREIYTCTSYFQFIRESEKLRIRYNTIYLDAVSAAKELKNNSLLGKWAELRNTIPETHPLQLRLNNETVRLEFGNDGRTLTTIGGGEALDHQIFNFIDWSNL